ncbi:YjbH domain-containing protein [Yoonia sediminilitoris]|uniref:Exopolysaccharide biosynthesis protein YbjH n=1 Tax=Yoonia sediminilitoris TaxID=1286148 RepID=A0A2T6KBC6_9RHOB|nr:YjbH domain-containing protein [Yoonia sediminilitoris]PUB12123.1 exopolysaccharide biosynthesis protein YbjH [Yoonia sediminilitoris]RCW92950.1 exopolysaccharide biosynthesis protein YbjH [Yoonia sediminilitoris]
MRSCAIWLIGLMWATALLADGVALRYNSYGAPGLIDMPAAISAPDAELAFSVSHFAGQIRSSATFQISSGLSGSFGYASLDNVLGQGGQVYDTVLDRRFALHFRVLDETRHWPAIAIGVNDFVGTGIYGGEYVVATKGFRPDLAITAGLGWGRLAGFGSFANPLGAAFAERPARDIGQGGAVAPSAFFHGDAALFGGVQWQATKTFGATLEYSSDALPNEDAGAFHRRSPWNVALTYSPRPNLHLSAQYLYGSQLGALATYTVNPTDPPFAGGLDRGPLPLGAAMSQRGLASALAKQGLRLQGQQRHGATLQVQVENMIYIAPAQAVGRTARVMAAYAPTEVRRFTITLVSHGIAGQTVTFQRAALTQQEFAYDGAARLWQAANMRPASEPFQGTSVGPDWQISPYVTPNIFDPDDPLRADVGIAFRGRYEPAPGVVFSGTLRQRIAGNLDQTTRRSESVLPHVRSDFALYDREGDADLIDLTASWFAQPGPTVTTRLTAGLLEEMFGGLSAEILWRPPGSAFAFGVELNEVRQRGYNSDFSFLDYQVTTGHASVYWDMGAGYQAQLDAGRYLAGDWGSTLHFARRFRNGWSLGAFATFTDVSFDDFGEGSFDKGITVDIPLSWISGQPTRQTLHRTIRPVTRDGGARLNIDGRLYDLTRPLTASALTQSWARVLR